MMATPESTKPPDTLAQGGLPPEPIRETVTVPHDDLYPSKDGTSDEVPPPAQSASTFSDHFWMGDSSPDGNVMDPLEPYSACKPDRNFANVAAPITLALKTELISIIYPTSGSERVLVQLAQYIVATDFADGWEVYAFHPIQFLEKPRSSVAHSLQNLKKWATDKKKNPKYKTLLIVYDLDDSSHSTLSNFNYAANRGDSFIDLLKKSGDTSFLILTKSERFHELLTTFRAHSFERFGYAVDCKEDNASFKTAADTFTEVERDFHETGLLTLWCVAWLGRATVDDMYRCVTAMLKVGSESARVQQAMLREWRKDWLSLLDLLNATMIEDRMSTIRLEYASEEWIAAIQKHWRLAQRLRHLAYLEQLKAAHILLNASPRLLQVFGGFQADLASLEPGTAQNVFVETIRIWMSEADRYDTTYTLAVILDGLLTNREYESAAKGLNALTQRGLGRNTVEILCNSRSSFVVQNDYLDLYNRVLPALSKEERLMLWSDLIRVRSADASLMSQTVTECKAQMTSANLIEFAARFVEEALLNEPSFSATLIRILQKDAGVSDSASSVLCRTMRSQAFKEYAASRSTRWCATLEDSGLVETWIIRSLRPLVPNLSINKLIGIVSTMLTRGREAATQSQSPKPDEQLIALLLIECASRKNETDDPIDIRRLAETLVSSRSCKVGVSEALRALRERFVVATLQVSYRSFTDTDAESRAARSASTFFHDTCAIISNLRELLSEESFTPTGEV